MKYGMSMNIHFRPMCYHRGWNVCMDFMKSNFNGQSDSWELLNLLFSSISDMDSANPSKFSSFPSLLWQREVCWSSLLSLLWFVFDPLPQFLVFCPSPTLFLDLVLGILWYQTRVEPLISYPQSISTRKLLLSQNVSQGSKKQKPSPKDSVFWRDAIWWILSNCLPYSSHFYHTSPFPCSVYLQRLAKESITCFVKWLSIKTLRDKRTQYANGTAHYHAVITWQRPRWTQAAD